jgi:hypothetical protein
MLKLVLLAVVLVSVTSSASTLSLAPSPSPGGYEIQINGETWFSSGNISVTVGQTTYSTSDASLKSAGAGTSGSGSDGYGSFTSKTQKWTAGATPYTTSTRLYAEKFVIFEQSFPKGAEGTNLTFTQGSDAVSSCFPSIDPQPSGGKSLGYVWWGGRAFLEGSQGGQWQGHNDDGMGTRGPFSRVVDTDNEVNTGKKGPGVGMGNGGGPFVVFGEEMTDSLVFSPANNFMTNSPGVSAPKNDGSFCFGLDAPVETVPAGYSLETMVYLGTGVNSAMKEWGTTMLAKYKTVRPVDYTTQWLGFSTDKYVLERAIANQLTSLLTNVFSQYLAVRTITMAGRRASSTPTTRRFCSACTIMPRKRASLTSRMCLSNRPLLTSALPFPVHCRHILLDSWWYTKGDAGGIKEWDATKESFPDGLKSFADKTDWKFMMHNRMWSDNNVYAKQNGGIYDFAVEGKPSNLAMPLSQDLWDDLISNKTEQGIPLTVYEQDWLYNEVSS